MNHNNYIQQRSKRMEKRKYYGNRKLHRLRAKLPAHGFNVTSTMRLLNGNNTNQSISYNQYKNKEATTNSIVKQLNQMIIPKETLIIKAPNYLNMTDIELKQKLSKVLDSNQFIIQYFNTGEILNYIRQYAQLLNKLYCLNYEQDLWQTYYYISIMAGIGSTRTITKEMAFENHLHRYLFTIYANIEKRQKIIIHQLKTTQYDLNTYQNIDLSIDKKNLLKVITTLVGNDLHQLRTEYEWKKVLFQYDANDYRLVKLFYDLKPSEDQIHSAKFIWQVTTHQLKIEEQLILAYQSLHTIDNVNYNKIISSIKQAEETIQNYKKIILDEKKHLLLNDQRIISLSSSAHVINIITVRQNNMHEHAQYLLKYRQRISTFDHIIHNMDDGQ